MSFQWMREFPQYSLRQTEKEELLLGDLNVLTQHHRENCVSYARLLKAFQLDAEAKSLEDVPYLPVGLFKSHTLASIAPEQVFRIMTSSGTTGQQVSRILLDRETAMRQTAALGKIVSHVVGRERLPMMLVESAAVVNDRKRYSARAAGLLGMLNFGRNHFYALNEQMELDREGVRHFLERYGHQPFLIFGFTFMVWQYLYEPLHDGETDLSNGILLHSGGWKKLQDQAVGNDEFKSRLKQRTGLHRIYNFYGMVEQVGSIYLEAEDGYLYCSNFADVIVRDPVTLKPSPTGEMGIIQVLSSLPLSYPGHSLLTEDLGVIHGTDDSQCGRWGKRFSVLGRVPRAELRGCSDVHASQVA
jgi:Acyl-protein synthetase, LuxE